MTTAVNPLECKGCYSTMLNNDGWAVCNIWYSEEGTGCGRSLPRPLIAVPITILLCNDSLLCSFNVPIKGLSKSKVKHAVCCSRTRSGFTFKLHDSLEYVVQTCKAEL